MKDNKITQSKQEDENNNAVIEVKVLNIRDGLKTYQNVYCLRINDKREKLIIMKDYMPIIGEVQGDIIIEMKDDTIKLSNITGYYMHYQNQFNLFL